MTRTNRRIWDLETTGIDTSTARIWEAAVFPDGVWRCNPGVPIPEEVVKICHLTPDDLDEISASPPWEDIAPEVIRALQSADYLVSQNGIEYDVKVLNARMGYEVELPRHFDLRVLSFEAWPDIPPHKLTEDLTLTNHKLGNVALYLKLITPEDFLAHGHEAEFDAQTAEKVWDRLPPKWTADLERLLAFQSRARQLQADDWNRYGVTVPDKPAFLWFRTCRRCAREDSPKGCPACQGQGFVHHTTKKRGQPVAPSYLDWLSSGKVDNPPPFLRY